MFINARNILLLHNITYTFKLIRYYLPYLATRIENIALIIFMINN